MKYFGVFLFISFANATFRMPIFEYNNKVSLFAKVIEQIVKNQTKVDDIAIMSSAHLKYFVHFHSDIINEIQSSFDGQFTVTFLDGLKIAMERKFINIFLFNEVNDLK